VSAMVYNRQLEAFITVAEAGSFSNAAKALFVSQSALTQQINLLERAVGFKLFERSNRGVNLTKAGESFYRDILQIVRLSSEALERSRSIAGVGKKVLRIGCTTNPISPVLFKACPRFQQLFPQVEQRFVEFTIKSPEENILSGIYDVIECMLPSKEGMLSGICYRPIVEDRCFCIVLPGHPLEGKTELDLSDLFGMTLCLPISGSCADADVIRNMILKEKYPIRMVEEDYDGSLLLRTSLDKRVVLASGGFAATFSDYLVPLKSPVKPVIALAYAEDCDPVVENFVDLAEQLFRKF